MFHDHGVCDDHRLNYQKKIHFTNLRGYGPHSSGCGVHAEKCQQRSKQKIDCTSGKCLTLPTFN